MTSLWQVRLAAGATLLGCVAVLACAAWLKPDPRGYGTHQQFGLGACGMILGTGLPCPTCGMTTAFSHTVRGQWSSAIRAQLGGFLLAIGVALLGLLCGRAVLTGRWPHVPLRVTPFGLSALLLFVLVGGWGLKLALGLADGSLPVRGGVRVQPLPSSAPSRL